MRVPVRIPLSGRILRIEYLDYLLNEDGDHISGQYFDGKIQIAKIQHKDAQAVFATLFHELTHAVFDTSGHSEMVGLKQEEAIVYALEHALAPIMTIRRTAGMRFKEVTFPWEE